MGSNNNVVVVGEKAEGMLVYDVIIVVMLLFSQTAEDLITIKARIRAPFVTFVGIEEASKKRGCLSVS